MTMKFKSSTAQHFYSSVIMPLSVSSKNSRGFTLVEILITIAIFSIVVTAGINLLGSALQSQRKILLSQELLDNASYVLEYMSRTLRMAKKDLAGNCISTGYNFQNPGGDSSKIRFLNYQQKCQEFFLENDKIKQKKSDNATASFGDSQPLTSKNLQVSTLVFEISGSSQEDSLQPKVTIVLGIQTKEAEPQRLQLQTSVSQRDLDIRY